MELGLSLGDSTKPLLFMDKPVKASNQLGLGFNTTLSIGPRIQPEEEEERRVKHRENQSSEEHDEQVSNENHSLSPKNHNPLQLDLLLHTPVVAQSNLPWPPLSENGSSAEAAGSSKVLDVNQLPTKAAYDEEAEEGSSPNSAASSFQMDLCIYSRGGSRNGSGNCNGRRDQYSDGEAYDQRASSRASDEDDNGGGTRKKLRLSKEQSAFLEESFKEHSTLNPKQKLALANQLNLRPRQVEVWFQNRRARTKLKQTEVDCEYLKRCCETLTEENRRLHKELQELRALKTNSNPFYMQLPATTLTMCPSCERVATNSTTTFPATASTGAVAAVAKAAIDTTTSKAIEFPIGKPRFFPFGHTQPHYPHQSTAS